MVKLILPLKAEYFDAIRAGTKTEEYRLANAYWTKRLIVGGERGILHRSFDSIVLTKGYPSRDDQSRRLELPWNGFTIKTITHPHFGPDPVEVFAIDVSHRAALERSEG
ncbi:ASCH domain-containing protein [Agrobacterium sp. OT33]|uniref:ASCH domain-containing protein n=1 Tax=Agrobacterium sp. OT33 TaxID=2815338 RepID=UPI001A8F312D|nr:ASCH domain-containing protein [Agrobacterium sp. OT33]MBO0125163.1 ASCH domain-containing protein [Agrobacterium sp. OT33]